jgi:hypothetical protein
LTGLSSNQPRLSEMRCMQWSPSSVRLHPSCAIGDRRSRGGHAVVTRTLNIAASRRR